MFRGESQIPALESFTREGWVQGCVFFTGAPGASFVEQVRSKHCLEEGKLLLKRTGIWCGSHGALGLLRPNLSFVKGHGRASTRAMGSPYLSSPEALQAQNRSLRKMEAGARGLSSWAPEQL